VVLAATKTSGPQPTKGEKHRLATETRTGTRKKSTK
jgi:hypothetical protein